jgi:hypothetical protein
VTLIFEHLRLAAAPALLARDAQATAKRPALLWFHGLGADKETHRPELARLAQAGFLAVGVDAVGHGERRRADLESLVAQPRPARQACFFDLIEETIAELPRIVAALHARQDCAAGAIALAGVSMGACVVYGALAAGLPVAAAAALLGTPDWPRPASPHRFPERFLGTALLSIVAQCDDIVPPNETRAFHRALDAAEGGAAGRHGLIELPGASHIMAPADWERAVGSAVAWLAGHALPAARGTS